MSRTIVSLFTSILCLLLLLASCDTPSRHAKQWVIDIQPFDDLATGKADTVYAQIKRIYPNVQLRKAIPLPAAAYYKPRQRYRADSIINILQRSTPQHHVTLALTSKDISTSKNGLNDWGIMGLGFRPGNACVASDFRLNPAMRKEQFYKICIHELGHTQGLPHCPDKTCFMRDAEGKNPTNEEVDFCPSCKAKLIEKGWNFSKK